MAQRRLPEPGLPARSRAFNVHSGAYLALVQQLSSAGASPRSGAGLRDFGAVRGVAFQKSLTRYGALCTQRAMGVCEIWVCKGEEEFSGR